MKAAHEAAAGLGQAWARDLVTAFHASLDYERMPGDMARRVAKATAFVAALDRALPSPAGIDQAALLDIHGAEGLRRQERLVGFLVAHLTIPWVAYAGIAHSAREATRRTLEASKDAGWHHDLTAFYDALAASPKPLSERSIRSYVGAARELLEAAKVERANQLTQRHLNAWLRRRPGRTNDMLRFLGWLRSTGIFGPSAKKRAQSNARMRERAIIKASKVLLSRLALCRKQPEGRALLARTIAIVHGVRLERVLAIERSDVTSSPESFAMHIGDANITLGPTLSAAFARFANDAGGMPFEGRAGIAPLSVDGTRHHLRKGRQHKRTTMAAYPEPDLASTDD